MKDLLIIFKNLK